MTEKQVKSALDFLIKDYNFEYSFQKFKGVPFGNWCTETYNYFNQYGCFTITNLLARNDIEYVRLDDISWLRTYLHSSHWEQLNSCINIMEIESEIWKKHEKKSIFGQFFWGDKKYLMILAEVIKIQIDKCGEFIGIKVKKED